MATAPAFLSAVVGLGLLLDLSRAEAAGGKNTPPGASEDASILATLYPGYKSSTGKLASGVQVSLLSDLAWGKKVLTLVKRSRAGKWGALETCQIDLALVEIVADRVRAIVRQDQIEDCSGSDHAQFGERSYRIKPGLDAFGIELDGRAGLITEERTELWIVTPKGFKRVFRWRTQMTDDLVHEDCSLAASLQVIPRKDAPSVLRVRKEIDGARRGCRFKGIEVWKWEESRTEFRRISGGNKGTCTCN